MSTFAGFPGGKLRHTPLPDLVFSELLPQMDNLAECKVTLHALWLLYHKTGTLRYVTLHELLNDATLLRSLRGLALSPEQALHEGLQRAVARGTLLHVASTEAQAEHFYFANTAQGRRSVESVQLGEAQLATVVAATQPAIVVQRPNIFVLYEQNIGLLQPIIAEELQAAEETFPPEWIEEAFRIAVEQNVRNWKYVRRVLERWEAEGKDKRRGKTWYTEEESRKYIKR
jgi:DnaD/phage-associated family protein